MTDLFENNITFISLSTFDKSKLILFGLYLNIVFPKELM